MSRFGEVLHGGPVDAAELARVRETVLFEQPERGRKLVRFWSLLTLAASIAAFGLYADSVATVIGAMIVAPLMLPIMGLAFGISIADRRAILGSLAVSLGGIATAIAVGYVLSFIQLAGFDPTTNTQIMVRTAPRLIDLLAALATGLAGAFATGRKDVSDTLPGVAIAISLVPPLANVGILLGADRVDLAMGSMLLFVTNYFAIVLTGSFIFGLMGYAQAAMRGRSTRAKAISVAIVIAMLAIIAVPLAASSVEVWIDHSTENTARQEVTRWAAGAGYRLTLLRLNDDTFEVIVVGTGVPPSEDELKGRLDGKLFGRKLAIEIMPARRVEFRTE